MKKILGAAAASLAEEMDLATNDVFAFAGARCDRIVAGVLERVRVVDRTNDPRGPSA